ncbi:MAG TPA: hypothetical protein VFS21_29665 [Roseiflexaceae bacterium]|nr:hypothetical protein [Roseiflexaceae bacterium]
MYETFGHYGTTSVEIAVEPVNVQVIALQPARLVQQEAYVHLLHSAEIVVYVIGEAVPKDGETYYVGSEPDQIREFSVCRAYAMYLGRSWEEIPWLWVMTRDMPPGVRHPASDVEISMPLVGRIPEDQPMVRCSVENNDDIQRLWNQLVSLLMR